MKKENKQELVTMLVNRIRQVNNCYPSDSIDSLAAIALAIRALVDVENTKDKSEAKD